MNKLFKLIIISAFSLSVKAQTNPAVTPKAEPYGQIDMADLEMKTCDFEKDANAEVLFDKASVITSNGMLLERHVRIKIFNDFGKNEANIRIVSGENIKTADFKGETINLNDGKVEVTPLDKKQSYIEKLDNQHSALIFTLPNVRAGSVIEYKYSLYIGFFSAWYFQSDIPTRYSEIETVFSANQGINAIPYVKQPYIKNVSSADEAKQVKALANIHSLPDEPFMGARNDVLQRIEYIGLHKTLYTWPVISNLVLASPGFGGQFERSIPGEMEIVKQAKSLKSDDEKIAFIFNDVKNSMKWNEVTQYYSMDGVVRAWNNKTGNSGEINMIVYRLLKKTGIKAYPMLTSSRNNGKISPDNPNTVHLNNTVVFIPIDSAKYYVLDATSKFNQFNVIPVDNLNTYGLSLDDKNSEYKLVFLTDIEPSTQSVFLNAEIKPDGKMTGTLERTSYSYNKTSALQKYKTDGEEKYIKFLCDSDNNIKMAAVKLNDMEVDSLPLSLKADFTIDLGGAENYIYFKTNLFMTMGANPFLSESRFSDIDFGYLDNYSVSGIYKLPEGYKTEALPKSITIVMPDQSIVFKRIVAEDNGTVVVRYALNHKKTIYFSDNYQDLRGFYKKMYEMLNEQIVLKKS